MVRGPCILVVRQQLQALGFEIEDIGLGWTDVKPEPTADQLIAIASAFNLLVLS